LLGIQCCGWLECEIK